MHWCRVRYDAHRVLFCKDYGTEQGQKRKRGGCPSANRCPRFCPLERTPAPLPHPGAATSSTWQRGRRHWALELRKRQRLYGLCLQPASIFQPRVQHAVRHHCCCAKAHKALCPVHLSTVTPSVYWFPQAVPENPPDASLRSSRIHSTPQESTSYPLPLFLLTGILLLYYLSYPHHRALKRRGLCL